MVAPEPSPPAGLLSNAQSRQKPPAPSLPKRPRPKTDVTIVLHVCRLFDAPWRFTVKTVDTRSVLLPIAAGIVAVTLHTPAHRCSGRLEVWRSPLGSSTTGNCPGRGGNRSRRGADDRAARDASG